MVVLRVTGGGERSVCTWGLIDTAARGVADVKLIGGSGDDMSISAADSSPQRTCG